MALQLAAESSHYKFYQKLVQFRQQDAFVHGSFRAHAFNDNVLGFQRTYGAENFVILINFGVSSQTVNLNDMIVNFGTESEVLLVAPISTLTVGQKIPTASFVLNGYDAVILKDPNFVPEVTEPPPQTSSNETPTSIVPETTTNGSSALISETFLLIASIILLFK